MENQGMENQDIENQSMENEEKQIKVQAADGERLLSEAETKRYRNLLQKQAELESRGYVRRDRIISLMKANTVGTLAILPFVAVVVALYLIRNGMNFYPSAVGERYGAFTVVWGIGTFVVMFGCFVVHELIHGFFWSFGAQNHWKDIEFGFIAQMLTPYCTCLSPLKKPFYILGSMMPMTLLGIVTGIIAIFTGNPFILLFSVIHIMGGAGDMLITCMILKDKVKGKDVLIFDHPYECGYILVERK